jgi:hypothetical protein
MNEHGRKRRKRRIAIVNMLLLITAASYTIIHARELRCRFVACSDLKKLRDDLYVDPRVQPAEIAGLEALVDRARRRDARFYGALRSTPVVIAGTDDRVIETFGQPGNRTAVSHLFLGTTYLVLGPDGMSVDVVAHEMMHAELSERIGWLRRELKIPAWFDEGLAMQADERAEYAEDAWRRKTHDGAQAPPLATLTDESAFTGDDYWRSFATAKHELGRWYGIVGPAGLVELIGRIDEGDDFEKTYRDVEQEHGGGAQ